MPLSAFFRVIILAYWYPVGHALQDLADDPRRLRR